MVADVGASHLASHLFKAVTCYVVVYMGNLALLAQEGLQRHSSHL